MSQKFICNLISAFPCPISLCNKFRIIHNPVVSQCFLVSDKTCLGMKTILFSHNHTDSSVSMPNQMTDNLIRSMFIIHNNRRHFFALRISISHDCRYRQVIWNTVHHPLMSCHINNPLNLLCHKLFYFLFYPFKIIFPAIIHILILLIQP